MQVRNKSLIVFALGMTSLVFCFPAHGEAATCKTVKQCRSVAHYNRSIVTRDQARFRVARGQASGKTRVVAAESTCHTVQTCRAAVFKVVKARKWNETTWHRVFTSNTASDAMLVVRYDFASCGPAAQAEAHDIVGWESGWVRFNINGAGDTSWWQFERPAHPDISLSEAEDIEWSTQRAKRDSKCGRDWSPEWSSVRDHGKDWN